MFAPGIKRKEYIGNDQKIQTGQLLDYIVQHHAAHRRGAHKDLRIGNKNMGLFSWALNQPVSKVEGVAQTAARTNLHTHEYGQFEGEIPRPNYGAGYVTKEDEGKVLITNRTPNTISFSRADKKHPERYTLIKPGDKYGKNYWLLYRKKTPSDSGAEKLQYKTIPKEDIVNYLKNLPEGYTVQPKLDGALNFVNIKDGKLELLSHRTSKTTGKPVIQTERVFNNVPHGIPKEFNDTVLHAELYGHKNDKPLKAQETSGLLNSTIENALKTKKEKGVDLKGMLFNISRYKGNVVDQNTPYSERMEMLKAILPHLPEGKFHLPEQATNPKDAKALWDKIKQEAHSHTTEGVIVHPPTGKPLKAKIMDEQDVYIKGFTKAEKGSKYENNAIGAISYGFTPTDKIVGTVSSGLSDTLRKAMYNNPCDYIGRKIKLMSQGQRKAEVLRSPVFLGLKED